MKQLQEMASQMNEMLDKIAEIKKSISETKIELLKIDNSIQARKTLISRNVLFNMPELKNEAQRNNEISIQCLADADLNNLFNQEIKLKEQIIDLEYKKDILESRYQYFEKMYNIRLIELTGKN